MVPRFREPRTMAHHLCAPRSMVPHLRVLRKKSKVQAPSTMPEAQYSGAATMVPVIPKPPLPSVAPKGCDSLTSSKECPTPSVVLQGTDYPANLATKRRNAPTLGMLLRNLVLMEYCRLHLSFSVTETSLTVLCSKEKFSKTMWSKQEIPQSRC